jgi:hypothetical protein
MALSLPLKRFVNFYEVLAASTCADMPLLLNVLNITSTRASWFNSTSMTRDKLLSR